MGVNDRDDRPDRDPRAASADGSPLSLPAGEVDELLGAWAIGALDDEAARAVEAALAADADLAAGARSLRDAAGLMAQPAAAAPPSSVRARVLDGARVIRPPGASVSTPEGLPALDVYVAQVHRLSELLATLPAAAWHRPADPYPWSVHGLLAHLLAVERYSGAVVGVPDAGWPAGAPDGDHLAMTESTVRAELARSPAETAAAWRAVAERFSLHLRGADLARSVRFSGLDMSVDSLLVVRSFEIWTHADDMRRAAGLPVGDPAPAELRTMSDRAVRALAGLALLAGFDLPPARARVVLTGDGGGTWDVAVGAYDDASAAEVVSSAERVTIIADVVDYCRLTARRISAGELVATVRGDRSLGHTLMLAAQAIAV